MSLKLESLARVEGNRLLSGYSFDSFLGGFYFNRLYLFEGYSEFIHSLLSQLFIKSIKQIEGGVVYVDGGNLFNPYSIIEACKRAGVYDFEALLEKIYIARAFTAFQMDTLLNEELEVIVDKLKPRIVVVTGLLDLFLDRDVDRREAIKRFSKLLIKLKKLTELGLMVFLITQTFSDRCPLVDLLYYHSHTIIRVDKISKKKLKIKLIKDPVLERRAIDFILLPRWQTTLEEFGVIIYG
jgi:hypothetical protein